MSPYGIHLYFLQEKDALEVAADCQFKYDPLNEDESK